MGSELGQQHGRESLPRLAGPGRPISERAGRPGRLGTVGPPAAVGAAAATSAAVGTRG